MKCINAKPKNIELLKETGEKLLDDVLATILEYDTKSRQPKLKYTSGTTLNYKPAVQKRK